MAALALLASIEAKTGKESAVAALLASALPQARDDAVILTWHAFQLGPSTFGIFATFADEAGCEAYLRDGVARAFSGRVDELLAWPPRIDRAEVVAGR